MFEKQEEQAENSFKGRTQIWESGANRKRENSFSRRAAQGKLDVLRNVRCPKCSHHKALLSSYSGIKKCCRCGYRYDQEGKLKVEKKTKKRN